MCELIRNQTDTFDLFFLYLFRRPIIFKSSFFNHAIKKQKKWLFLIKKNKMDPLAEFFFKHQEPYRDIKSRIARVEFTVIIILTPYLRTWQRKCRLMLNPEGPLHSHIRVLHLTTFLFIFPSVYGPFRFLPHCFRHFFRNFFGRMVLMFFFTGGFYQFTRDVCQTDFLMDLIIKKCHKIGEKELSVQTWLRIYFNGLNLGA